MLSRTQQLENDVNILMAPQREEEKRDQFQTNKEESPKDQSWFIPPPKYNTDLLEIIIATATTTNYCFCEDFLSVEAAKVHLEMWQKDVAKGEKIIDSFIGKVGFMSYKHFKIWRKAHIQEFKRTRKAVKKQVEKDQQKIQEQLQQGAGEQWLKQWEEMKRTREPLKSNFQKPLSSSSSNRTQEYIETIEPLKNEQNNHVIL